MTRENGPSDGDRSREGPGRSDPVWQCLECGGGFAENPEECPDCGSDRFRTVYLY